MLDAIRTNWSKANAIWKKHGFEILLILTVVFIFIMALFRRGRPGTWNKNYILPPKLSSSPRKPPQESKGEIECRNVLETYFKKPFPKERPDILRNPVTGGDNNLELDCYNKELKLAVEYNGIQHYKYIPYFHKTRDAFQNQKYRDYMKKQLCEKNGITLIDVPYTVKIPDIKQYIIKELKKAGITI